MDPHSWALHWDVLAALVLLVAAFTWTQTRWPSGKGGRAAFELALILLLTVYVTPLHTIALHYLLSVHLLQNVVTAEWAPGLVVLALAPSLARALERHAAFRLITHPLLTLPLWLGTYFAWHVPPIYDTALEQGGWLLNLEHLSYFVAGALMWWPVVQGRHSDGAKALYLFVAFVLASPLGLLLALLPRPVYDFYRDAPGLWGISDLTDQQIAGVTMAVEQAIVFFAVFTHYLGRFLRAEQIEGVFIESRR